MLRAFVVLSLCLWTALAQAASVKAVRLWPSPDYSRITLELSEAVVFKQFALKNPDRLVVDLEGIEPQAALTAVTVSPQDPLIASLRAALNRPGVTRLVVELKTAARAQLFTLQPAGEYGYRLVMDLYPSEPTLAVQLDNALARAGEAGAPRPPPETPVAAGAVVEAGKPGAPRAELRPARGAKPDYVRLVTIAIDPGHGGEDPGALGASGSREKDITLAVARRLKGIIDKQPNMRAYLTRDGDYFIPLHERVSKARKVQADLFVSVHADAFVRRDARGSSVFALSEKGATSAAAKWLAKRENEADLIGGINIDVKDVYLKQTLIDLSQTAQIADSLKLGSAVLEELGGVNDLHRGRVEQAGFAVLKAPDIPSILIETAFISNPEEEKRLNDEDYQEKLAQAIVAGFKRYFDRNPPLARDRQNF
jgi:N-acetylmuramoyl-L-alanine amidase